MVTCVAHFPSIQATGRSLHALTMLFASTSRIKYEVNVSFSMKLGP